MICITEKLISAFPMIQLTCLHRDELKGRGYLKCSVNTHIHTMELLCKQRAFWKDCANTALSGLYTLIQTTVWTTTQLAGLDNSLASVFRKPRANSVRYGCSHTQTHTEHTVYSHTLTDFFHNSCPISLFVQILVFLFKYSQIKSSNLRSQQYFFPTSILMTNIYSN